MLKRALRYILRKMGFFSITLNYSRKTRVNGIKTIIPSIAGITCELSEPWMIGLLSKALLEKPGTFLDVGANVGQTLVSVKAVDPHREYIGFEPNPACVFYINELIKQNGFDNSYILPTGVFTEDTVIPLELSGMVDQGASLIKNFRPGLKLDRVFVAVFRFESLARVLGVNRIGIIKIDVEGAELEVVKSMLTVIKQDNPIIIIEILPVYSEENAFRKNRQDELEEIFIGAGYALLRVEKTETNTYAGVKPVDKIGIHSDLTQCDYVVVPIEQLDGLQMALNPAGLAPRSLPAVMNNL